jgi:hypothetical protein
VARRHKHKQTLPRARRDEVIAHLLAIEVYLLGTWRDIGFPVDHEIDSAPRLIGDRVGDAPDISTPDGRSSCANSLADKACAAEIFRSVIRLTLLDSRVGRSLDVGLVRTHEFTDGRRLL